MTRTFVPLRRIVALSVAITLFTAPIASAQTAAPASTSDAPANTALLSNAAFARLISPPQTGVGRVSPVTEPPHLDLLRQATARVAKQPLPPPTQAPERSWMSRHKWAFIIPAIAVGAVLGGFGLWVAAGCGGNDCG